MGIRGEAVLVEHYEAVNDFDKDFRNFNLFHLVASMVRGNSVVDIGCGAAIFPSILQDRGKHVVGVEPSSGMRDLAAKNNPGVRVLSGAAEDIDTLLTEPVDSVTMLDVLEHIENDIEQVKKVHSVLKQDGEFLVVVPAHPFLYGERDRQMGHYRRYTKKSLRDLLVSNGFYVERIRYWNALGVLPYLISEKILRKPLETELRKSAKNGMITKVMRKGLHLWFSLVENNLNFGFGLSLIVVAKKI